MLYGRALEMTEIDRLLAAARAGRSGAVTVLGDVGSGKTAILDYAATSAAGMRVLRITGVESESELPFAALHLLLRPALDRIDSLPGPQAAALRSALGVADASPADRLLVGLATLTLLAELADSRPLLCVIDDAHWLDRDSAMALVFAARRLDAEGVALVFGARESDRNFVSSGLPEVRLDALDQDAASQLLAEYAADLAPHVRDRLIADSTGNPLALIELSAALSAEQRAGRAAPLTPHLAILPVSRKVQDTFLAQIGNLPGRSRLVLLVAAADTTEDRDIVLRAAQTLGASADDLAPAESSRLIQFRAGALKFRHPLIRSAVYESASTPERIAVHRALAGALDRQDQSDRRAWHLAASTTGPDERIAAVMESAAKDARRRGGYAAEAAALERAAQLSPDNRDRARRLVRAAAAAGVSGQLPHARAMAERAVELVEDPLILARAAELRAYVVYALESPRRSARILLEAAAAAGSRDPALAARTLIYASQAAFDGNDPEVAMVAAQRLTDMAVPPHLEAPARSVTGMALIMADELLPGVEAIRRSLPLLAKPGLPRSPVLSAVAVIHAILAGDDQAAYDSAAALAQSCRTSRMTNDLPVVLLVLAIAEQFLGLHVRAHAHGLEALHIADGTGQVYFIGYVNGMLARMAAIEGDEQTCRLLTDKAAADANSPEMGWAGSGWAGWALGLLDLGLGRHEGALARLSELAASSARHTYVGISSLPDLVEASVAAGRPELGAAALERFEKFSVAAGQPWASAVALRCRGILGHEPEKSFAQAVRLHGTGGRPFERARTELLYGQWLRRARRRADARVNLQSAASIFDRLGATPWADRARGELRATGANPPGRDGDPSPVSTLTPQELQVARLAAAGLSNRDIAAQLFLSPRTVGYHLYKAYPKLGVTTRAQLARIEFPE
jgi:DNA-binding CsgD family transcriptional regulator/tetratricopeptide (TPR) repeat protein